MAETLIGMLRRAIRIVVMFWPVLLAWFMFGVLGRYLVIRLAGLVGASSFGLGIALMPLAILFRLVAFVAMLLVVREALPHLIETSPVPHESRQRRRQFVDALTAGILPFFAFYLAWGFMRTDMADFYLRVDIVKKSVDYDYTQAGDVIVGGPLGLSLTWVTGGAIIATFVARRLIKRYSSRSARVLPVVAVYLEALWVMLAALLVTDLTSSVVSWFKDRQGIAWLSDIRDSIAIHAAPVDWVLTVGGWLIGEIGGIILLPLAWLAIAGVIYGQTLSPSSPALKFLNRGRLAKLRERANNLPGWMLRRAGDIWGSLVASIRPVVDAFKLMWHAGPLLIATYVLLFRGVEWISGQLDVLIAHLIGPQTNDFWFTYTPALSLIAPTITAPLTVAVVAAVYNSVLGRLRPVKRVGEDQTGGAPSVTVAP